MKISYDMYTNVHQMKLSDDPFVLFRKSIPSLISSEIDFRPLIEWLLSYNTEFSSVEERHKIVDSIYMYFLFYPRDESLKSTIIYLAKNDSYLDDKDVINNIIKLLDDENDDKVTIVKTGG